MIFALSKDFPHVISSNKWPKIKTLLLIIQTQVENY